MNTNSTSTTNISTTLDVLRMAAHALPGSTVRVSRDTMQLDDGGHVYTVNEVDVRGAVLAEGRLHIVVDINGMYPVREGSVLHEQINARRRGAPALSNN